MCRAGYDAARAREKRGGSPSGGYYCLVSMTLLSGYLKNRDPCLVIFCHFTFNAALWSSIYLPEALVTEKAADLLKQLESAWADGPGKPGSGMLGKTVKVKLYLESTCPPSSGELSLWTTHS